MNTIAPASRLMARAFALLLVAVVTLAASVAAFAAPTLLADAHPATGPQPAAAEWSQDSTTWAPCVITARVPSCDLASITTPGSYTLRMRYTYTAACNGGDCWAAGAAVSAPFAFRWLGVPATSPSAVQVTP